jgi:hypothetical protein
MLFAAAAALSAIALAGASLAAASSASRAMKTLQFGVRFVNDSEVDLGAPARAGRRAGLPRRPIEAKGKPGDTPAASARSKNFKPPVLSCTDTFSLPGGQIATQFLTAPGPAPAAGRSRRDRPLPKRPRRNARRVRREQRERHLPPHHHVVDSRRRQSIPRSRPSCSTWPAPRCTGQIAIALLPNRAFDRWSVGCRPCYLPVVPCVAVRVWPGRPRTRRPPSRRVLHHGPATVSSAGEDAELANRALLAERAAFPGGDSAPRRDTPFCPGTNSTASVAIGGRRLAVLDSFQTSSLGGSDLAPKPKGCWI